MRLAVVVFCLTAYVGTAFAQDAGECQSYPTIPINLHPRFDDPAYDYSADLSQLQALANDPTHTVHSGHKGLTLGLTRYEPFMEFRLPIKGVKFSNGLACAHVDYVDVNYGYKNVVVYIPHEVPQGSCGFNEVMKHEQKHIAVNRAILDEYAPLIQAKLQAYLKLNGVFREENPDYAISLLNQKLQAILDEMGSEMNEENHKRQRLVDSLEEYRRVSATCNGQLTQAASQYYRTGK